MLRALFAGLVSIGCAAETYTETITEPVCGWAVVMLVSFDEDAGDCEWSIWTHDPATARLRSVDGAPTDPAPLCEIVVYERIGSLRPMDSVEVWAREDMPRDDIWRTVETSGCH